MNDNRKVFDLPDGDRLQGYAEYGVDRPFWGNEEDEQLLYMIRRAHPHRTADGHGLLRLETLQNSQLCGVCRGLESFGPKCWLEVLHLTLYKIRNNADDLHCPLCRVIALGLGPAFNANYPVSSEIPVVDLNPSFATLDIDREWAPVSIASFLPQDPEMQLCKTLYSADLWYKGLRSGICQFAIYKAQASYDPDKSHESLCKRKFDKIRAWFTEDLSVARNFAEQHFHGEYFPSRVIDVGLEAARESPHSSHYDDRRLRLLDTREAKRHQLHDGKVWVCYAALSHRWSMATESSSTTRANLKNRISGFETSDLCQTFQDAVRVAREMKIPYLWIDSLCIVQNDSADWDRESKIMGEIYMNSMITLAAHSFEARIDVGGISDCGGGDGFLKKAFESEGDDPVLLGTIPSDSGQQDQPIHARRLRMFEVDISNSPLSRRGWIVQERLLPPRILHFFPNQLYWESRSFDYVRAEDNTPHYYDQDELRELVVKQKNMEGVTPLEWFKIVERFCVTSLTVPTDKLPAIAGLASQFQKRGDLTYLAGLFEDRIVKGLLWAARGPRLIRYAERAPSWSWASVDGPIKYSSLLLQQPFRVLPCMKITSHMSNMYATPKHLPGFDNVTKLSAQGTLRRIRVSAEHDNNKRSLLNSTPIMKHNTLLYELDDDAVYRHLINDQDELIGWVSLDEDDRGPLPQNDYYSAIVASEEGWLSEDNTDDIMYRTHPPTQEYEAWYATGRVEAEHEYLSLNRPLNEVPPSPLLREPFMMKTYWILLLVIDQENPKTLPYYRRVGMGQVVDSRWQQPKYWCNFILS